LGSATPPIPRERSSDAAKFLGFSRIYAYTLQRRTTKFDVVTHKEGLVFRGKPRPYRKWAGPQCSPIFGVPFHLCVHPLSQNKIDLRPSAVYRRLKVTRLFTVVDRCTTRSRIDCIDLILPLNCDLYLVSLMCCVCNGLLCLWATVSASLLAFLSSSRTGTFDTVMIAVF